MPKKTKVFSSFSWWLPRLKLPRNREKGGQRVDVNGGKTDLWRLISLAVHHYDELVVTIDIPSAWEYEMSVLFRLMQSSRLWWGDAWSS